VSKENNIEPALAAHLGDSGKSTNETALTSSSVLHHEVQRVVSFNNLKQLDNIRVVHPLHDRHLACELQRQPQGAASKQAAGRQNASVCKPILVLLIDRNKNGETRWHTPLNERSIPFLP